MKYQLGDKAVECDDSVYFAPGSHVIGDVVLGAEANVWFNAVVRGDCERITIGAQANIQDNAVVHADPGQPCVIGKGVTVGHKAVLHGCEIGDYSLVGINAVVLNGAKIGRCCLIGANALVTENMVIPDFSMVIGSPAKIVKTLPAESEWQFVKSAEHYVENAKTFAAKCVVQSTE